MTNFQLGIDGTYSTFSGADAIATFNGMVIGELQAITVNVSREKGPIYVMGNPDPLSFSRGKRGVAGNLVFVMFDHDALITQMELLANQRGTIPQYTAAGNLGGTVGINVNTIPTAFGQSNQTGPVVNNLYNGLPVNQSLNNLSTVVQFNSAIQTAQNQTGNPFVQLHGQQPGELWTYEDQIPPFDITVTFANEYGAAAYFIVEKVEILNEGMGISIDDLNLERMNTFVARAVQRVRPGLGNSGIADTSAPIAQSFKAPAPAGTIFT